MYINICTRLTRSSHKNQSTGTNISNEINVTVFFPENDTTSTPNSMFKSQDDFRKFLLEHTNARVENILQSKPTQNRRPVYK